MAGGVRVAICVPDGEGFEEWASEATGEANGKISSNAKTVPISILFLIFQ